MVDMSEALFNELAFFRLMQDLDDPLISEKMKKAEQIAMQVCVFFYLDNSYSVKCLIV